MESKIREYKESIISSNNLNNKSMLNTSAIINIEIKPFINDEIRRLSESKERKEKNKKNKYYNKRDDNINKNQDNENKNENNLEKTLSQFKNPILNNTINYFHSKNKSKEISQEVSNENIVEPIQSKMKTDINITSPIIYTDINEVNNDHSDHLPNAFKTILDNNKITNKIKNKVKNEKFDRINLILKTQDNFIKKNKKNNSYFY